MASMAVGVASRDRRTGRAQATTPTAGARPRLPTLDVLRGLAIVGMLLVDNAGLPEHMPSQLVHTGWQGLHLADLVFPLFLFVVGMAMPRSARTGRPQAVLGRAAKLVVLGCLLVSATQHKFPPRPSTGVLQHIAAAYLLCWLVLRLPRRLQLPAVAAVLLGLWAAYAFVDLPGVDPGSWRPGTNLGQWVDDRLGFAFSAESPHVYPASLASVFAGVLAGRLLLRHDGRALAVRLALLGVVAGVGGAALATAVPVSKVLWTPSYVLVTTAICCGLLIMVHAGLRPWLHSRALAPLVALGRNAIVAFAFSELVIRAGLGTVRPWLVAPLDWLGGAGFAAVAYAAITVTATWALCHWLARHQVIVRL